MNGSTRVIAAPRPPRFRFSGLVPVPVSCFARHSFSLRLRLFLFSLLLLLFVCLFVCCVWGSAVASSLQWLGLPPSGADDSAPSPSLLVFLRPFAELLADVRLTCPFLSYLLLHYRRYYHGCWRFRGMCPPLANHFRITGRHLFFVFVCVCVCTFFFLLLINISCLMLLNYWAVDVCPVEIDALYRNSEQTNCARFQSAVTLFPIVWTSRNLPAVCNSISAVDPPIFCPI